MCNNTAERFSTVKDQFYYNDVTKKHHCKICEKGYITFRYKNGNYNRHMLTHFRTTCIPVEEQRHRNLTEANKAETDCEMKLRQLYPGCTITVDKRNLMESEFPKADRILNGKVRIQVKKTPYERIHNWISTTHIEHAKNVWGIQDMKQRLTDIVLQDELNIYNRLIKYRRRPGKSQAIINFFSFTVSIKSDREYRKVPEYTKITDLNTKKMFLHWDKNEKNNFYHMYGTDMDNIIQLTDDVIEKMNIVYDVRAVYNTSGRHNNNFENIFMNDTDINEMILLINK